MSIPIPDSPDELIRTWAATGDKVLVPVPTCLHERLVEVIERLVAENGWPVRLNEMVETALWNYLDSGACWGI